MPGRLRLMLPLALGAAGLTLYGYLEYKAWRKQKGKENKLNIVSHRLMLNKVYANVVISQADLIARSTDIEIEVDKQFSEDDIIFSLLMKGSKESVQEAEACINRIIENAPEMTSAVLEVPKKKIMVIVENFSSKILSISQETGCKIFFKCIPDFYKDSPFCLEIQGPSMQAMFAYNLINNILVEEPVSTSSELEHIPKEFPLDIINDTVNSNFVGVVISFIGSISSFWVQLHRLNSTLDKMERRLFERLSTSNVDQKEVLEPKVGMFIAVPYIKQGKWHRARIVSASKAEQWTIKALFVDYGDIEEVKLSEIKILPEEFLQYPYFAVECCLAGISPNTLNSKGEKEWSEEALDVFEALVFKSHKILMAQKMGEIHVVGDGFNEVIKRCIPSINLVDTNEAEDKIIAAELVSKGYAVWSMGQNLVNNEEKKEEEEEDYDDDDDEDGPFA